MPPRALEQTDVLIIGGGAAGLMCAIEAGRRKRRVIVLERNPRIGRKILISGGGRCNFTNLETKPENFISANPHFAKSALARFGPQNFIRMVERRGIPYHEKKLGQLFCDGSASEIVAMLEAECAAVGVAIVTACAISEVQRAERFVVETSGAAYEAESLVVASGGLSIPKIGATPFGYSLAKQFGLKLTECRPALVPLTFGRKDRDDFADLSGVSADAAVTAGQHTFREKMLFTHRGVSGPAILQSSSYWKPGGTLEIDLLPDIDLTAALRDCGAASDRAEVRTIVSRWLPKRLANRWFEIREPARSARSKTAATLSDRGTAALSAGLHAWRLEPAGTEGYEKAEVTAGGVDTAELSSKTMEARNAPGLYFIGEVVDVTGQLGGFNFQWAWASGYSAGQVV